MLCAKCLDRDNGIVGQHVFNPFDTHTFLIACIAARADKWVCLRLKPQYTTSQLRQVSVILSYAWLSSVSRRPGTNETLKTEPGDENKM